MFVAGFIGSPAMNLQEVPVDRRAREIRRLRRPAPPRRAGKVNGRVVVGFRPEALEVVNGTETGIEVTVQAVEELGADAYVYASLDDTELVKKPDIIARIDPAAVPAKGSRIKLKIRPDRASSLRCRNGRAPRGELTARELSVTWHRTVQAFG